MRTFNTQAEIDAEIKDGVFRIDDDVTITFDWYIIAGDIYAGELEIYAGGGYLRR